MDDSYTNAQEDAINVLYSTKCIHRRGLRKSLDVVTLAWCARFRRHHLQAPIGYIPQAAVEADYCCNLSEQAMLA